MKRPRIGVLRVSLIIAVLTGAAALPAAGASDAGAGQPALAPPGRWDAAVSTAAGTTEPVTLVFRSGGDLLVVAPDGEFTGTWHPTGRHTFGFDFTRTLVADDGTTVVGSIDITHRAAFTGPGAFSSTGTAVGTALDGTVRFTAPVGATATRAA